MSDPVGLIGGAGGVTPGGGGRSRSAGGADDGAFRDLLMANIDRVNQLQEDATRAIEDLQTGQRDDVEGVLLATAKADTAFRLLQQVRNKVFEAYREIQQMRV
ncbi:MAG: flagellar hook-basal body complex protein FliE [Phycisphaerales bacterium]